MNRLGCPEGGQRKVTDERVEDSCRLKEGEMNMGSTLKSGYGEEERNEGMVYSGEIASLLVEPQCEQK